MNGTRVLAVLAALAAAACGSSNDTPPPPTTQQFTIQFAAVVGATPFACSTGGAPSSYSLGSPAIAYSPKDLRFYVHNVRLILHDGTEAPLEITDDGTWQRDGVALLDFEDATGSCSPQATVPAGGTAAVGSAATRTVVVGTGPIEHVHGIKFTVGVPESLNHVQASTAQPPFNVTPMFWNWTGGYRHMRIDGITGDGGVTSGLAAHNFHVGSTGCFPLDPADLSKGAYCNTSNRPEIYLAAFDPETQAVALDLEPLFAAADLGVNTAGTNLGCMSFLNDPECELIFPKLGLPYGTAQTGLSQTAFKAQAK